MNNTTEIHGIPEGLTAEAAARLARAGEFTERAFLNGTIEVDLTKDIRITGLDSQTMTLMAEVRDTKGIVVETKIVENSVVVATATYK